MELDNLNEKDSQDVDRADRPSTEGITHPADSAATEKIYPPKKVVLPTMIALFLVFFLVALVCQASCHASLPPANLYHRTVPSSAQPYPPSRPSSTASGTSRGTNPPSSSLSASSNYPSVSSSNTTPPNGSSSRSRLYSKLGLSSALPHPPQTL
jgi:hypothetical protein